MRKLLIFAVAFSLMAASAYAGTVKIGVIDMQKIVFESKEGKKAKAEWDKEYNEKKQEIDKKTKELQKLQEELKKNAAVLSEKAKKQKQEELRKKAMELQFLKQEAMQYLQKRNAELVDAIIKKAIKIIQDYGKKNGYTLIIDRTGKVVYSDPSVDLTKKIIQIMDKSTSAGKKK